MGFSNIYKPPVKPKVGYYLEHNMGQILWRIRHISRKTGFITAERKPGCVLKIHRKHLAEHFIVRDDVVG
jgi:hypothetical protein